MKAKQIRLCYGIFLSVLTAVLGGLFIAQAVCILADGNWVQGAYSREIVAERLFPVSIVLYVWIAAVIAGFVLSLIFPYSEKKVTVFREEATLRRLSSRIPEGSGEAYEAKMKCVREEKFNRLIVYIVCAAVAFVGVVVSAVYLLNSKNFENHDKSVSMLKMLVNVGPWVLIAFAMSIFMTTYEKSSVEREITLLKDIIASNKGNPVTRVSDPSFKFWAKIKAFFDNKYTKLGIQIGVGVIGVTFVFVGIFCTEGARDVLLKAIDICTECIGLG